MPELTGISVTITDDPAAQALVRERLLFHRAVLERHGVGDLASLGSLDLEGRVTPQSGITVPAAEVVAGPTVVQSTRSLLTADATGTAAALPLVPSGGAARLLRVLSPAAAAGGLEAAAAIPLDTCYLAATEVNLAAGTQIDLQPPHRFLTIIAERITVGEGVLFSWEQPKLLELPQRPPTPGPPPQPGESGSLTGVPGLPGARGLPGGRAPSGADAPHIELWALEMTGHPGFDLAGQDGWRGGPGGHGGPGGAGSPGRPEIVEFVIFPICKSGPGNGGDGGDGGPAGDGGLGGDGGHGGRLSLYAPREVLERYSRQFFVSVDGGRGAIGGPPGLPGEGGPGGPVGRFKHCPPSAERPRHPGRPGRPGAPGNEGPPGAPGGRFPDAVQFQPVTVEQFREQLTRPAVVNLVPNRALAGTLVTVVGLRLSPRDTVVIDGRPVATEFVSDTLLTFVVPKVEGAHRVVQVRRADGAESNRATLYVLPRLDDVAEGGRLRPGTTVTLRGSGFAGGALVRVNGQDMPDVRVLDSGTVTFTLRRPEGIAENPAGERATARVVLADGTPSNDLELVLDTFRMLVLGDSVAWGQGLQDHQKAHTILQAALRDRHHGMGAYKTVLAHSGATIGVGDPTAQPAIEGEVPTSHPTVLQQCDAFDDAPDTIDLIVVNGGLNDVNFRRVINPLTPPVELVPEIERRCHGDMATLLRRVLDKFGQATVLVTGYYPIISDDSDTDLLEPLLIALGIGLAGLPGGITAALAKPRIANNCRVFAEHANLSLQAAVEEVNDERPGPPRAFFANPAFSSRNAALAPEPWLFGINPDLSPQDTLVAGPRAAACQRNAARTDVEICKRASAGHPNARGAQEYAGALLAALDRGAGDPSGPLPRFPDGFLLGAATAAIQVEGGIENTDWQVFTTDPLIKGRVEALAGLAGERVQLVPPGAAIGHRDLGVLGQDLDRAVALGLNAYRLSIEWARVQPAPGDVDEQALDYYRRVLDELESRGLTPVVTLNHLSLPQWVLTPPRTLQPVPDPAFLASLGGWSGPKTVDAFARFAELVADRLGDRVRHWLTVNEPVGSTVGVGYIAGMWPPGLTGQGGLAREAHFNLIRAHIRAYDAIKQRHPRAEIGFAHNILHAKTTAAATMPFGQEQAARNQFDYFYSWHFLNAVIDGKVDVAIARRPSDQVLLAGDQLEEFLGFPVDDAHPWRPRCDFIGLNYYRSVYVFFDAAVGVVAGFSGGRFVNDLATGGKDEPHHLLTELGWEISPEGLGLVLRQLRDRYGRPVLITENGLGERGDHNRASYLVAHLEQVLSAIRDGVDVRGYLWWTLADNWEWHKGYAPEGRFGLFRVDRDSQARQLTDAAAAVRYVTAEGGLRGTAERYGTITPAGDRVRAPRRSPVAVFQGAATDEQSGQVLPLVLHLASLERGGLTGLLRVQGLPEGERWLRLDQVAWDEDGRRLRLEGFEAVPDGDRLSGRFAQFRRSGSWEAVRVAPVGLWTAGDRLRHLQLSWNEAAASGLGGKWLARTSPAAWRPLEVSRWSSEDGALAFGDGTHAFTGTVSGDRLHGTLRSAGSSGPWEARRAPTGLPF
jgi:beta-glucosidase/6-phospho-beta-glucosidase/beta-galactosidase/lysophospholipase L1-like esterase